VSAVWITFHQWWTPLKSELCWNFHLLYLQVLADWEVPTALGNWFMSEVIDLCSRKWTTMPLRYAESQTTPRCDYRLLGMPPRWSLLQSPASPARSINIALLTLEIAYSDFRPSAVSQRDDSCNAYASRSNARHELAHMTVVTRCFSKTLQ
jgi:hypothetical protein